LKDLATGKEEIVFKEEPKLPNFERMYGFSAFTCNLNYINEEMKKSLPTTDCRRRPDQRLMEEGDYDRAAEEKHRLEEKQRAVRKQRE
jgi:oxysterol-binding protein 1